MFLAFDCLHVQATLPGKDRQARLFLNLAADHKKPQTAGYKCMRRVATITPTGAITSGQVPKATSIPLNQHQSRAIEGLCLQPSQLAPTALSSNQHWPTVQGRIHMHALSGPRLGALANVVGNTLPAAPRAAVANCPSSLPAKRLLLCTPCCVPEHPS